MFKQVPRNHYVAISWKTCQRENQLLTYGKITRPFPNSHLPFLNSRLPFSPLTPQLFLITGRAPSQVACHWVITVIPLFVLTGPVGNLALLSSLEPKERVFVWE